MRGIIKLIRLLYYIVTLLIIVTTVDFFQRFSIRKAIVIFLCKNTKGDCHFKVEEIYGFFHDLGSFLYLLFGQSKVFFVIGQIITLLIYWGVIWLIIKTIKFINYKALNE